MPSSQPNTVFGTFKSLLRPWMVRSAVSGVRFVRRLQSRPRSLPADPEVSIIGFCETASGLGVAARGMYHALAERAPQCVSISELSHTPRIPSSTPAPVTPRSSSLRSADIALHVYNPDIFLAAVKRFGTGFLTRNRVNVAVAIWETESPPPQWAEVLSLYDAVWTHSRFSARGLEKRTHRPVDIVPICLPEKPSRKRCREDNHYDFLVMFDQHSCLERKHPRAAIRAFRRAAMLLPPGTSARLRVKCHADTPAFVLETLRTEAGDAPIEFIVTTLDDPGMESLWQECDCLLSLHRSEGFGLPVAEALSRAIPVIASRQGGILDFADDDGCFLVSGHPAVAPAVYGNYQEWSGWIEPDVKEAAAAIVAVVKDYGQAVAQAERGRAAVQAVMSPQHVRRVLEIAIRKTLNPDARLRR
jgi:glycosyltransferase involved in cell wall biosynthesis